jgi:threonine dehydrogenase-like Zn-dependent dehydrogenase
MPGHVSIDLTPLWHREVQLVGAYAYGAEGSRRTFDLAFELVGSLGLGRMVSARYPLERFAEAIEHAAAAGRRGAVKVTFDLRSDLRRGPPH